MENPKGYIIYLPEHPYSAQWAGEALASGRALGWNLELYPGIDGRKTNCLLYTSPSPRDPT